MCKQWEGNCAESLKKSWEPFGSCLLNSTANPAHFHPSLAELPNGSHNFFQTFSMYFLNYFIKNPQNHNCPPILTYNISALGGVLAKPLSLLGQHYHLTAYFDLESTLCSLTSKSHYCSPRVLWTAGCFQQLKLLTLSPMHNGFWRV